MNKSLIIYGSLYGSAKRYAEKLAELTGIEAVDYKDVENISNYNRIIYLGALYAGGVTGLKKTASKMSPEQDLIIATVGLADPTDLTNTNNIKQNIKKQIPANFYDESKIFHLRGVIDYKKLGLKHRVMMSMLVSKVKKLPESEQNAETRAMIATYDKQVDFVDFSSLKPIVKIATMNKMIAICGLNCEKCDAFIATKNNDQALREKTAKLWSELNKTSILPEQINCEGCRMDGAKTVFCSNLCEIRKCAVSKNYETCGDCPEMEHCPKVGAIHSNNAEAKKNLAVVRLKYFGLLLIMFLITSCISNTKSLKDLKSEYVTMNDSVSIHYKTYGDGDKAICFVHGFGCDLNTWEKQFECLQDDDNFRLIFIDLPGYGESSKPHFDYTLDFFAQAVNKVLDENNVGSVTLVGHSLGTPVCRYTLMNYHKGDLVDVDGVYCFYDGTETPEYVEAVQQFGHAFDGPDCEDVITGFVMSLAGPDTSQEITDYAMSVMPKTPQYVASSTMRNLVERQWWPDTPFEGRAMVICTLNSGLDQDNRQKMERLYPNLDYTELTTCGHFIQMEQADMFNEKLKQFVLK